ncbi:MAG TPA: hypothetical protein PKA60_02380 [Candidatus Paceibacterota bacterium]|nr:hypothetical protein [Candidatus Paceibacterota bacterium]
MIEFEQKRIIKKRLYSKFTIFVLLVLVIFLLHSNFKILQKSMEVKRQAQSDAVKLQDLENRKNYLENQLGDLESDLGREKEIRSKFYLAKEDESVVVIIDKNDDVIATETESSKIKNFFGWIRAFFD